MANKPLSGLGILVTRPAAQAQRLASLVAAAGGRPFVFPVIDIEPLGDHTLPAFEAFDVVIFVSPTAVRVALAQRAWPRGVLAAGVGAGTRRELERRGVREVLVPKHGADSEGLLALEALQNVAGKKILIVRGQGGRALLGTTLAKRGALVDYAECYRRVRPQADWTALLDAWEGGEVHAVTVTSGESLDNLVALLGERGKPLLARTPLFVAHARIAAHAKRLGIAAVVADGPGDEELVARLVAYFGAHDRH